MFHCMFNEYTLQGFPFCTEDETYICKLVLSHFVTKVYLSFMHGSPTSNTACDWTRVSENGCQHCKSQKQ